MLIIPSTPLYIIYMGVFGTIDNNADKIAIQQNIMYITTFVTHSRKTIILNLDH